MLTNFFGKSNPVNLIITFVLFLGFYSTTVFSHFTLDEIVLQGALMHLSNLGLYVLLFFFFNFILAKNKLTLYNSYGFLFFVILFGIFPFTIFNRYELFINVVLLIFLRRVFSLRTPKATFKKMFDSGFWLSISFIFNPFTLVFGILIYTSIALFQKLTLKTLLIPMVGFLVPLFCYFTYCFWYDEVDSFWGMFLWYTQYNFQFYTRTEVLAPLIFVGLIVAISIALKTPKVFLISGNYRKFWILTLVSLLVSVLLIAITKNKTGSELMYAFFPLSVILTNWVEGMSKRFFQELVLAIFLIASIVLLII